VNRERDRPPRVSVLMTIYNAAPFLEEALESLLAQTFTNWELVAVENGSTDESPGILDAQDDRRFRVHRLESNIGRTPALRRAFDLARGDIVAVLDADDVSLPHRLEDQLAFLDEHPATVLVGSWTRLVDEGGSELGVVRPPAQHEDLCDLFAWCNPFVHSSCMYRREPASSVGGYPEDLPYAQDGGLWIRLIGQGNVGMLQKVLCEQRVRSDSMTGNSSGSVYVARDGLALLLAARERLSFGPEARRRHRDEFLIARIKYGLALFRTGSRLRGLGVLGRGILANPVGMLRNRVVARWMGVS
jgi:glycosyltransferase involved in cell wall biosynthesis